MKTRQGMFRDATSSCIQLPALLIVSECTGKLAKAIGCMFAYRDPTPLHYVQTQAHASGSSSISMIEFSSMPARISSSESLPW